MEFKYIALTMVIILICLFAFTPVFSRKEKHCGKLEAIYFEHLKSFQAGTMSKDDLIKSAKDLAIARGQKSDLGLSMVENDLIAFSQPTS